MMTPPSLQPLRLPSPWPPPELPQREDRQSWLEHVPLLGAIIGWWRVRRQYDRFLSQVLQPIEDQIREQLAARSQAISWPGSQDEQKCADLMAMAVAKEKGLQEVALHPDDPVELLFWGAEDDLSALLFATSLHKEFNVTFSDRELQHWIVEHRTASEVIALCLGMVDRARS